MAIDFPNSPSENQEFTTGGVTYVYHSPRWTVKPVATFCVISDTAPTSIPDGQMWWNSLNGNLYIYYNDGSSTQWVQINNTGAA